MADEQVPIPRSQVSLKTIATISFTLLGILGGVYILANARLAITVTVAGTVVAVALHHGVDFLRRRGVRRGLAIALVLLAITLIGAGMLLLVVPPAVKQGRALVEQVPELLEKARRLPLYEQLEARLDLSARLAELRQEAPSVLERAAEPALAVVTGVLSFLGAALAVYGVVIFMLFFGEPLVKSLLDEAVPPRREVYERVLRKIYNAVGGYLGGLGLICLSNATLTSIFLAILGQPFFLPLGILSGLSSLVPLAGNTLMGTLISLIVLATGGLWRGVACAIFFILYQQLENHLLGPLVYRRTVSINPLVTIIGLLVFAELAGIPGAVIAVPALAVGQIILREILRYRREHLRLPRQGPASGPPAPVPPSAALEPKPPGAPEPPG